MVLMFNPLDNAIFNAGTIVVVLHQNLIDCLRQFTFFITKQMIDRHLHPIILKDQFGTKKIKAMVCSQKVH